MNLKIFKFLFLAIFASTLGQGLIVPLLPAYAHSLGASGFFIGLIFGAFSFSRSLFLPYFGKLSDKKGRKPFITVGLFLYFCASIAFMFSNSVPSLIVIRFFQGIAAAMILPVAQAYAGEISPKGKEGSTMGMVNIAFFAGLSGGPILGGIIKEAFGLKISFLCMGIVCLAGFLLCLIFLPPVRKERFSNSDYEPVTYKILLKNKYILGIFLIRFSYIICVGAMWTFLPLLAEVEYSMSSGEIGIIMSLTVLITAIVSGPMGLISDKISKRLLLGISGVFISISIFALYYITETWQLYFVIVVTGIGGGMLTPAVMAMAAVLGRSFNSMGTVMSILTLGHSLGMFIGPISAGIIMDLFNLKISFIGGGVILLFSTTLTMLLTSGFRQFESEENLKTA